MKRARDEGSDTAKARFQLQERMSKLAKEDKLLRLELQLKPEAKAWESREAFNTFVTAQLPRIAERACVRGDDRKQYEEKVLGIIRAMHQEGLVSQAFSKCLELHCSRRMGKFDSEAWKRRARRIFAAQ
jgi:hypothetical protein